MQLDKKQAARQPPQPQLRRRQGRKPVATAAPSITALSTTTRKFGRKQEDRITSDRRTTNRPKITDDVCYDSIVAVDEGCSLIDDKTGFDIFIAYKNYVLKKI